MATEQEQPSGTNDKPKERKKSPAAQLREKIANFLLENFDVIEECFEIMPPKEKVKVYTHMLAFVVPKKKPLNDDALDRLTNEELEDLWKSLSEPPPDISDP